MQWAPNRRNGRGGVQHTGDHMQRISNVTLAALVTAFAGLAHAQSVDPSQVSIAALNYGGNGCPAGSVAANLSPDAQAFTLLFSDFAVDGANTAGARSKKSCNLVLDLNVPSGWTYTLFSVDYRGYAYAERGNEARLRSWYSLGVSGGEEIRIANLKMRGPFDRDFHQRAGVPLDSLPWVECGGSASRVRIGTELMATDKALIAVDSIDGELSQRYGISWRRCATSSNWQGSCQAVLETVWGTNMNTFTSTGSGRDHTEAKNRARDDALAKCEAQKRTLRPLVQAMARCVANASQCGAVPR